MLRKGLLTRSLPNKFFALRLKLSLSTLFLAIVLTVLLPEAYARQAEPSIGMAVEFNDHAASAYIARDKGWFREQGLRLSTYEGYVTGMALAAALARGDIQVAYICLVPAINVYANARVRIKIVAGTHKYGYGLVVNPEKIKTLKDIQKSRIRIGCIREGGSADILLHKVIDKYRLDPLKILPRVQRMNPPKLVLAIKMEQLDAAFLPEEWASMAENFGFRMYLTSLDVWPHMQGSVLVVKERLIKRHPQVVRKLVGVTQKATQWVNQHPDEAAVIMSRQLSITEMKTLPVRAGQVAAKIKITPKLLLRSMTRLEYTTDISPNGVQEIVDYMARLGYINHRFNAKDILDLRFIK